MGRARSRQTADLAAVALLALIVGAFFFPLWGQGGWIPRGGGDAASFLFPMYRFIAAALRAGDIPLWNPHQYAGHPLIADNQSGMFYPPNLALFLLHPTFGYRWLEALVGWHLFWAGLGMWQLLRAAEGVAKRESADRSVRVWPALIGATAFAFSDLFVVHLGNLNLLAVAAWLPWALGALLRAIARRSWGWATAAGAAVGAATLAGHGQMTFLLAFLLIVAALWQAAAQRSARPLGYLAWAGAVGVLLSAVTLLPALELNALSRRGAFSYADSVNYSLPPRALVGLAAPGFFGRNAADFRGDWPRVEVGYAGVVTLLLAAVGARHSRSPLRRFLIGAAVLSFLLALGGYTPVHRLLLGPLQLPFQVPARFVAIADLCLALLAALGAQVLAQRDRPTLGALDRALLGLSALAVAALLVWRAHESAATAAAAQTGRAVLILAVTLAAAWVALLRSKRPAAWLCALLVVELFVHGQYSEVEWNDPVAGYNHPTAVAYLQANAGLNRIDEATGRWQASAAQLYGLYSAGGVFNPLQLAAHAAFMESVGFRGSPTYNLMGVKYIIADKGEPPGDVGFLAPVSDDDPQLRIWLNTRALPRALVLHEALVVPDHDAAFAALFSGVPFTRTVILEAAAAAAAPPLPVSAEGEPQAAIGVVAYELNRVVLDVTADRPGYVLLTDLYYPGWRATVNGQPAPILRADYAFRAVPIAAGTQRVEMTFRPLGWQIGWPLSAVGWALVLAGGVWAWRRRPNS